MSHQKLSCYLSTMQIMFLFKYHYVRSLSDTH